jgi:Phosphoglycerate dehydrogenase and related dehydrogenases
MVSTTAHTAHQPTATPRLVIALTEEERTLFFGSTAAGFSPLPAEVVWLRESDLTESGWRERLQALAPSVLVTAWQTPPLPSDWLQSPDCPLRYVCHVTGSVRRLVPRVFLERGGWVSNWGTLAAATVAEHALLLGLASLRNLVAWRAFMQQRPKTRPAARLGTRSLFGRRVGLHGFGAIARELVALLRPFRASVAAYSAGVPPAVMQDLGVEPCTSLETLFARSDIVFGCEALMPSTIGSVTASALAALPDGAVFVNVGRGRIADEDALLREAKSGRIRVAVDVVSHEPIDASSPWLDTANALVSPHIGGPTLDMYPEFGRHALDNLQRYFAGQTLAAVVTCESYDRST